MTYSNMILLTKKPEKENKTILICYKGSKHNPHLYTFSAGIWKF